MRKGHALIATLLCLSLGLLAGQSTLAAPTSADLDALLDGVKEIAAPGVPGGLCLFSDQVFPVVVGKSGRYLEPVVAAGRYGKGRCVVFGHGGYFGTGGLRTADTGKLVLNAIRWATAGATPRIAVYRMDNLATFLRSAGLSVTKLGDDWPGKLAGFNLLVVDGFRVGSPQAQTALQQFLRDGGGLLMSSLGWGWLQLNPGKSLRRDFPGNQALAPVGIAWADSMLSRTSKQGYDASQRPPALVHAARALAALESNQGTGLSKSDLGQASHVVTIAARCIPEQDKLLRPRLVALRDKYGAQAIPRPDAPLGVDKPLARLALVLQLQELRDLPPEKIKAHPAAKYFPGEVPADAPRVSKTLTVDTATTGWHSTGLYAAPGEIIEAKLPASAVKLGLALRIGVHQDRLWNKDSWRRCPEICWRVPMKARVTRLANPFGGPVYVEVPRDAKPAEVPVEISGAVEAPYFVLGKVTPTQWRQQERSKPAPWAELQCQSVILTVPSSVIRDLDNPVELMEFWDNVLDADAILSGRPILRKRPERYVTDTQISAGYMHSGYPIMTHLDIAPHMVNYQALLTNERGRDWGLFHEMGHNHQSGDWTFGGTVEVTVNLFTLYVLDKVCGKKPDTNKAFKPENRAKALREYLAEGAKFETWKKKPFLALIMYVQLEEAFGWETFRRVFAEYRDLPKDQKPKTDAEKRDQWMVRFSRAVGRNLGPFFQAWGVPTSQKARDSIKDLPPWMPPDWPAPQKQVTAQ